MIRMQYYDTYAPGRVQPPYDCAHQKPGPGGNTTKYCLQSRFYSCVTEMYCPIPGFDGTCTSTDQANVANFLACAEAKTPGGMSSYESCAPCAKKWGLNTDKIEACASGGDPLKVITAIQKATEAAKPSVSYFPDVRVAGKQLKDPTAQALIKAVCHEYNGNNKPAVCK